MGSRQTATSSSYATPKSPRWHSYCGSLPSRIASATVDVVVSAYSLIIRRIQVQLFVIVKGYRYRRNVKSHTVKIRSSKKCFVSRRSRINNRQTSGTPSIPPYANRHLASPPHTCDASVSQTSSRRNPASSRMVNPNWSAFGQSIEEKTRPYRGGRACLYGV
jgi:hypothetical protein